VVVAGDVGIGSSRSADSTVLTDTASIFKLPFTFLETIRFEASMTMKTGYSAVGCDGQLGD
jgi:hypothetical protein